MQTNTWSIRLFQGQLAPRPVDFSQNQCKKLLPFIPILTREAYYISKDTSASSRAEWKLTTYL